MCAHDHGGLGHGQVRVICQAAYTCHVRTLDAKVCVGEHNMSPRVYWYRLVHVYTRVLSAEAPLSLGCLCTWWLHDLSYRDSLRLT